MLANNSDLPKSSSLQPTGSSVAPPPSTSSADSESPSMQSPPSASSATFSPQLSTAKTHEGFNDFWSGSLDIDASGMPSSLKKVLEEKGNLSSAVRSVLMDFLYDHITQHTL